MSENICVDIIALSSFGLYVRCIVTSGLSPDIYRITVILIYTYFLYSLGFYQQ